MQVWLFIMLYLVKMYKDFFQRRIFSTHGDKNNFSLRNLEYKNNDINNFLKQYFGLSQSVLNGTKHSDRCFRRNQSNAE